MHKYNLGFISDAAIYEHVKTTVEAYRREITQTLHHKILSAGRGWKMSVTGFDLENNEKHIYAKIVENHKTINEVSARKLRVDMQSEILEHPDAICYLIEVLPEDSHNEPWVFTIDGKSIKNDRIRCISIDKFYEIVFDDANLYTNLCKSLPKVIEDVLSENPHLIS